MRPNTTYARLMVVVPQREQYKLPSTRFPQIGFISSRPSAVNENCWTANAFRMIFFGKGLILDG